MEVDNALAQSDDEYEEFLIYVDIDPTSLSESQINSARVLKIHGLETQKPLLQINNQFFEGNRNLISSTINFKMSISR